MRGGGAAHNFPGPGPDSEESEVPGPGYSGRWPPRAAGRRRAGQSRSPGTPESESVRRGPATCHGDSGPTLRCRALRACRAAWQPPRRGRACRAGWQAAVRRPGRDSGLRPGYQPAMIQFFGMSDGHSVRPS
eukprot:748626-Hanusia_phi.AAC.5